MGIDSGDSITLSDLRNLAALAKQQRRLEHVELTLVKTIVDVSPIPMWVKRLETGGRFRMLFVNPAYERQWHILSKDYSGKLDDEIWPPDVAEHFRRNDQDAVDASPKPHYSTESVPTYAGTSDDAELVEWNICKVAIDTGASILIPGLAWPIEPHLKAGLNA